MTWVADFPVRVTTPGGVVHVERGGFLPADASEASLARLSAAGSIRQIAPEAEQSSTPEPGEAVTEHSPGARRRKQAKADASDGTTAGSPENAPDS